MRIRPILDLTYLPKALRWFRLDRGWKQCEVAKVASLSPSMLSGYEKGSRIPSLESLARLLDALGVSLARLEEVLTIFRLEDERKQAGKTEGERMGFATHGSDGLSRRIDMPAPANDRPYALPAQLVTASELAEPSASRLRSGSRGRAVAQTQRLGFDPSRAGRDPGGLQATLALLRNLQSLLEEQMADRKD